MVGFSGVITKELRSLFCHLPSRSSTDAPASLGGSQLLHSATRTGSVSDVDDQSRSRRLAKTVQKLLTQSKRRPLWRPDASLWQVAAQACNEPLQQLRQTQDRCLTDHHTLADTVGRVAASVQVILVDQAIPVRNEVALLEQPP